MTLVHNGEDEALPATLCELLSRSGLGDQSAFAELYDRTSSRVYGVTWRVVGDPLQAETIVERGYLALWRDAGLIDSQKEDALERILTVVHRLAVEHARSDDSWRIRNDTASFDRSALLKAGPSSPSSEAAEPTDRDVADCLTDVQRQTLTLAYIGAYTNVEIADQLGLDLTTINLIMRNGLRHVFSQIRTEPQQIVGTESNATARASILR